MMIMPLAITQVHWPTFIQTCQEQLGYSPTRNLDDIGIDLKNPASFLGCLDFANDMKGQLQGKRGYESWSHFHVSFIFVCKISTILFLKNYTKLSMTSKRCSDEESRYLVIASGSIFDWRLAVIHGCSEIDTELRKMMNYCLIYLQESGFRDVWTDYDKIGLPDGSFVLRRT